MPHFSSAVTRDGSVDLRWLVHDEGPLRDDRLTNLRARQDEQVRGLQGLDTRPLPSSPSRYTTATRSRNCTSVSPGSPPRRATVQWIQCELALWIPGGTDLSTKNRAPLPFYVITTVIYGLRRPERIKHDNRKFIARNPQPFSQEIAIFPAYVPRRI
jgi:hypothetical protein